MTYGKWAWVGLAAGILAYEAVAPEGQLLSETVDEWIAKRPAVTYLTIAMIACHLANITPEGIDPIHQLTRLKHLKG